jgi:hypothetical protein
MIIHVRYRTVFLRHFIARRAPFARRNSLMVQHVISMMMVKGIESRRHGRSIVIRPEKTVSQL